MIDNLSLLTTSLAILYVIYRAAKLDRTLSWIGRPQSTDEKKLPARGDAVAPPWRERGRQAARPAAPERNWRSR